MAVTQPGFSPQQLAGIRHRMRCDQALELPLYIASESERRNLTAHAAQSRERTQRKLDGFTKRALVRAAVLARLRRLQEHVGFDRQLDALVGRMEFARQEFTIAVRRRDGKCLRQWDQKSGDARLDPDDAREEAARFSRRVSPKVLQLIEGGARVSYAVFTMPNFAPGDLRRGCRTIYRRFSRFLRRCKAGKVPTGRAIRGAAVVLEAPLGRNRDWNVHLNVLLVHNGFIDYSAIRAAWHWDIQFQPVAPTELGLAKTLRELIKYSVQAVPEKDTRKPQSPAPPLIEWTDPELWEWIRSFRRFRRTRTYGELYRLPKPEPLDHSEFVVVGFGTWSARGACFRLRFPLLDLVPEDKSHREFGHPQAQPRAGPARAGPIWPKATA